MSCSSNSNKPLMTLNNETTAVNKKPPSSSSSSPPHQESSSSQADAKNGRGRKPAVKTPAAKKQPQRGLGVAQLERLRMQERWKKMTEMPSTNSNINGQVQLQQPLESVPVQFGAGGYGGRLGLGGGASASLPPGSILFQAGIGSGAVMNHGSNHVPHDYQMMNNNSQNNSQFLTPNPQYFDNYSFRKKRFSDEIDGGGLLKENYNNINNNNPNEMIQINNLNNNIQNFSGTNINIPNNYNDPNSIGDHLTLGFGTSSKVPRNSSSDPHYQDLEVMTVHKRKPNLCANVVEYEFFPGLKIQNVANNNNDDNYNYNHDYGYSYDGNEASYNYANNVPANGGGSSTSDGYNNNNNLDLSLKL